MADVLEHLEAAKHYAKNKKWNNAITHIEVSIDFVKDLKEQNAKLKKKNKEIKEKLADYRAEAAVREALGID